MAEPLIINIVRGKDYGTLSFDYGNVHVATKCWWDPTNKVDVGTYTGAATRMTNKTDGFDGGNREAIYLGLGIPCNGGSRKCNGIFIHRGTSAAWSEGCIVADQHEVLRIWQCINPKDQYFVSINISDQAAADPSVIVGASPTINIVRGKDDGTLSFRYGDVNVETQCWWDPTNKVNAGTYTGAATRMANKTDGSDGGNREAIYLGQGILCNNGSRKSNGIFIHKGKSAAWSEGCIVANEQDVLTIWRSINPKDEYIVSINVSDQP